MDVKEYNKKIKLGEFEVDSKGNLKTGEILPEFQRILDKGLNKPLLSKPDELSVKVGRYPKKDKIHKYRARKTLYSGILFDSKKEANRCAELDLLKKAGKIVKYELQPRFDVIVNDKFICFYKADFKVFYKDREEIEDVKGYKKGQAYQMFRLKVKLIEAIYGIKIIEK